MLRGPWSASRSTRPPARAAIAAALKRRALAVPATGLCMALRRFNAAAIAGRARRRAARRCYAGSRITAASVSTFGQELFKHITTVVPYWRACDEAWPLADDHLTGIGVLRNYGGQVMVLPWSEDTRRQLVRLRELLEPISKRIIVVVDDREPEDVEAISAMLTPIVVLPWSGRSELAKFVIKDSPD
jgi:hypothetical protein